MCVAAGSVGATRAPTFAPHQQKDQLMHRRIHLPLLLVAATGIMACATVMPAGAAGSDNGVANKSANQIAAAASKAMTATTGFSYAGTVKQSGSSATLNVSLTAASDGHATLILAGQPVRVIRLGGTLYLSSTKKFWTSNVSADFATQVGTGWGSIPTTDANFEGIATLLDSQTIVNGFLSQTSNAFTKGKTSTVNGKPVIALNTTDKANKSSGGTTYIATTGQPYIVKITSSGGGGSLSFRNYNRPAEPTAPANPIAIPASSSTSTTG
jgi:hypothetical protein